MIKFLRDLFFNDVWLKLFSLALAVLIWLTVSLAVQKRPEVRTFSKLPVVTMSATGDVRQMRVRPALVDVTVQGERTLVNELRANDILIRVDLTGMKSGDFVKKRVEVSTLAGITLVRVEPQEVEVVFPVAP
jgi:YbbR domain-containing protein